MSDEDASLASCDFEHLRIWNSVELAVICGGKVDCWLTPTDCKNDSVMNVSVSLEADQGRLPSHFGASALDLLP